MYSLYELVLAALISSAVVSFLLFRYFALRKKQLLRKERLKQGKAIGEEVELKEVLDNIASGVFIRELGSDRYLYFNKEARKLCGNQDGTEAGGFGKIIGKSDVTVDVVEKEDEEILATGRSLMSERVLSDENGEPCSWIQIQKCPIKSIDGRPLILGSIVDVTSRKMKKIELRNVKEELQMALDAGGLEVWVYHHHDASVTDFYQGKECNKQQVFYQECKTALSIEDYNRLDMGFRSILNGKRDAYKAVFQMQQEGESDVKYFECRMKGVYSQRSGRLSLIIGVRKDITQEVLWQKDVEANRLKTNLAIKAARMVLWEYDGVTNKFSSPDPQSIVHTPVEFKNYFSMMHPEDVPVAVKIFKELMSDTAESNETDVRILMPDGEYSWVHLQGSVSERDKTGKPIKMVGIRRDIDTEKRLHRQLVEMKEEAERASKLKSAYLANMSHEIRTPLNAIVGFSNLMMYTDEPEEKEEYNRIIQTNNELLLQLINDILDLSKIEAGFLTFNYENENISDIFRQLEQAFASKVNPDVVLKASIPYEKCIVSTDRNRFIQIVTNFLTNACKFTQQGSVEFGYKQTEKGLTVYVTDTGIGMTREECDRVFDRFTKYGNKIAGTGLGMAICETLVKMMGGTIGVHSVLGEGSTFWAEIPCELQVYDGKSADPEATEIAASVFAGKQVPGLNPGKYDVLIAEDNDSNYLLASKILEKDSTLRRAYDGAECVEMFVAKRPDIVLMDIQMPVMNGYEATAAIREIDSDIPIVAVTANAFDSDKEKALVAGCNDYITKPLTRNRLLEALNKWCPRS